jgi:hypothetical protein
METRINYGRRDNNVETPLPSYPDKGCRNTLSTIDNVSWSGNLQHRSCTETSWGIGGGGDDDEDNTNVWTRCLFFYMYSIPSIL